MYRRNRISLIGAIFLASMLNAQSASSPVGQFAPIDNFYGSPGFSPIGSAICGNSFGDFDKDGDPDAIGFATVAGKRSLVSRRNIGIGQFEAMQTIAVYKSTPWESAVQVQLIDMDKDGDIDILETRNDAVRIYLNDGKGVFANPWATSTQKPTVAVAARFVAAGDVDGDGDIDLVLGRWGKSDLIYLNNGKLVFSAATKHPASSLTLTYQVHLADIDADKDLDMITVSNTYQVSTPGVEVFVNNGKGVFTRSKTAIASSLKNFGSMFRCHVADLDKDNDLDLIVTPSTFNLGTLFFINSGKGVFGKVRSTSYRGIPADMDGDGDLDLAATVETYYENKYLAFTPRSTSLKVTSEYLVAVGDFDGDGDTDMFSGYPGVYSNQGNGKFARMFHHRTRITAGGYPGLLGDLDGDGDLDYVVLNPIYTAGRSHPFTINLNDGRGNVTREAQTSRVSYRPVNFITTELADVDGDGDLDMFFGNQHRDHIYLNDGKGHFADTSDSWIPKESHFTWRAVFVDVDGDKDLDMISEVSADVSQKVSVGMRLHLNTSKGFVDSTAKRMPTSPGVLLALHAADFDGDKDVDVLISTATGMRMLLNNGSGTFSVAASTTFPKATIGGDLKVGDLDGDGDLDIASFGGKEILFNNGKGVFTSTALPTMPKLGWSFLMFDVDVDGDLDLMMETAVVKLGSFWVDTINVLLLNNGKGKFTKAPASRLPLSVQWVGSELTGDLDGDGDIDVVGKGLMLNLHRQLWSPHRALIGGRLRLDFFVAPGYTPPSTTVRPIIDTRIVKPLVLPAWGNLYLDPSTMVILPPIAVSTATGRARLDLNVPKDTNLLGITAFVQGWTAHGSDWTKWRITNLWQETILR